MDIILDIAINYNMIFSFFQEMIEWVPNHLVCHQIGISKDL